VSQDPAEVLDGGLPPLPERLQRGGPQVPIAIWQRGDLGLVLWIKWLDVDDSLDLDEQFDEECDVLVQLDGRWTWHSSAGAVGASLYVELDSGAWQRPILCGAGPVGWEGGHDVTIGARKLYVFTGLLNVGVDRVRVESSIPGAAVLELPGPAGMVILGLVDDETAIVTGLDAAGTELGDANGPTRVRLSSAGPAATE
jgi:hypothetical protein